MSLFEHKNLPFATIEVCFTFCIENKLKWNGF